MSDERNGNGGAGGGDDVDDLADKSDPTIVLSPDELLRDSLASLGGGLCAAGDDLIELADLVLRFGAAAILPDAKERIAELVSILGGAARAVRRLEELSRKETP